MYFLILTGRFGMGHCNAAEAIREQLSAQYPDAEISVIDLLEWLFPLSSDVIYHSFNFAVRYIPFMYNTLNRATDRVSGVPMEKTVCRRLKALMEHYTPNLVISTLPFCSQYMSAYKMTTHNSVPLYTFITDIAIHEDWIAPQTDRYFVGAEETKNALVSRGVPADRVSISGIPVRSAFYRENVQMNPENAVHEILIMGGGLGLLPVNNAILKKLCAERYIHVTVLAGKNETLRRHIARRYPQIEVLGWTPNVEEYLHRADLLITKPGGVTTFEAIETGTPLCILRPFLVQEVENAKFIERTGIGKVLWKRHKDPARAIFALLHDRPAFSSMCAQMALLRSVKENAMDAIREAFAL